MFDPKNSPPRQIQVAAALIQKDGKFLITQRLKKSHLGHLWEFPGGKIEEGESPEACVVRECQEELGLQVRPFELFKELLHEYPEICVHLFFLRCEWMAGDPQALECAQWAWVNPEELKKFEFPEADRELLEELVKKSGPASHKL